MPDHGGYCNMHGRHMGYECPECPYEAKIAELQSKLDRCAEGSAKAADDFLAKYAQISKERDEALSRLHEALEGQRHNGAKALEHWEATESLKKLIATLETENKALVGRLDSACRVEHEWRTSTFLEHTSPHWVCKHCGKSEPKKHDEYHVTERVVERQER